MNISVPDVGRMMYVTAYHPVALAGTGELHQFLFEIGNIGNRSLYLLLDSLRQRIVGQAVTTTPE